MKGRGKRTWELGSEDNLQLHHQVKTSTHTNPYPRTCRYTRSGLRTSLAYSTCGHMQHMHIALCVPCKVKIDLEK